MARGHKLTDRARERLWELGREARREYGAFLIPEVSDAKRCKCPMTFPTQNIPLLLDAINRACILRAGALSVLAERDRLTLLRGQHKHAISI